MLFPAPAVVNVLFRLGFRRLLLFGLFRLLGRPRGMLQVLYDGVAQFLAAFAGSQGGCPASRNPPGIDATSPRVRPRRACPSCSAPASAAWRRASRRSCAVRPRCSPRLSLVMGIRAACKLEKWVSRSEGRGHGYIGTAPEGCRRPQPRCPGSSDIVQRLVAYSTSPPGHGCPGPGCWPWPWPAVQYNVGSYAGLLSFAVEVF